MTTAACPSCKHETPAGSRFCPACGLSLALDDRTIETPRGSRRSASPTPTVSASTTTTGRFAPGAIFAGRYRVVGLLGTGGMGEVYRADDLTLDQPVALKFLPEAFTGDPDRRSRFYAEVRTARGVSHPNVCRVYDVGEFDGLHYLSMEYVDGEDLSVLLRRIGRLPDDKGLELARQIAAGLAAAHDRGIVHRDLKPANVMIDGRGRARITDFGLAALAVDVEGAEIRAGTPAYMAPEQLAGREVTVRSDIYSMGLILYEMFTGRRASRTDPPASALGGIDPAIERVISRCLEADPRERPQSALGVAAALPGGDPLAAALAAGETPSPELVAQSGGAGALAPVRAWTLASVAIGLLLASGFLAGRARLQTHVPLPKPTAVLEDRAREILSGAGPTAGVTDDAIGFTFRWGPYAHVLDGPHKPDMWKRLGSLRPGPLYFWYRGSPGHLSPHDPNGTVSPYDPPLSRAGMSLVRLDPDGRLVGLEIVPSDTAAPVDAQVAAPRFEALLAATGLEILGPDRPVYTPRTFADTTLAWRAHYPETPADTVRVEAAAHEGRPVRFEVVAPWAEPWRQRPEPTGRDRFMQVMVLGFLLTVVFGGGFVAHRNLKLGRGDRRGATRLAGFLLLTGLVDWLLTTNMPASVAGKFDRFVLAMGPALFFSAVCWLLWVAIEPFVRRHAPHRLVATTRVLSGRVRDPLVGRDVLIGCAFGAVVAAMDLGHAALPPALGIAPALPFWSGGGTFLGTAHVLGDLAGLAKVTLLNGIFLAFLPTLFRMVLRKEWLALGLFYLISVALWSARPHPTVWLTIVVSMVQSAVWIGLLARVGILALTVSVLVYYVFTTLPVDLGAGGTWYGGAAVLPILIPIGLVIYGAVVATSGSRFRFDHQPKST